MSDTNLFSHKTEKNRKKQKKSSKLVFLWTTNI